MKKILVFGGTGFIGAAACRVMAARGHHVIAATKTNSNGTKANDQISDRIPLVVFTQYDEQSISAFLKSNQIDEIHFLSGNPSPENSLVDPYLDIQQTNLPLLSLLESVRKVSPKTVVWFASSVAVYGKNNNNPLKEEGPCLPISAYGISKLFGEHHLALYASQYGLHTGIYRLFSTYGPDLKRQLVYDIIKKIMSSSGKIELYGLGTETRDLSFVVDQAKAITDLSSKVIPSGEVFNLGSGTSYSVQNIFSEIRSLLKSDVEVEWMGQRRAFDGSNWCADTTKLRGLGITYPTSLQDGLKQTIQSIANSK